MQRQTLVTRYPRNRCQSTGASRGRAAGDAGNAERGVSGRFPRCAGPRTPSGSARSRPRHRGAPGRLQSARTVTRWQQEATLGSPRRHLLRRSSERRLRGLAASLARGINPFCWGEESLGVQPAVPRSPAALQPPEHPWCTPRLD